MSKELLVSYIAPIERYGDHDTALKTLREFPLPPSRIYRSDEGWTFQWYVWPAGEVPPLPWEQGDLGGLLVGDHPTLQYPAEEFGITLPMEVMEQLMAAPPTAKRDYWSHLDGVFIHLTEFSWRTRQIQVNAFPEREMAYPFSHLNHKLLTDIDWFVRDVVEAVVTNDAPFAFRRTRGGDIYFHVPSAWSWWCARYELPWVKSLAIARRVRGMPYGRSTRRVRVERVPVHMVGIDMELFTAQRARGANAP